MVVVKYMFLWLSMLYRDVVCDGSTARHGDSAISSCSNKRCARVHLKVGLAFRARGSLCTDQTRA